MASTQAPLQASLKGNQASPFHRDRRLKAADSTTPLAHKRLRPYSRASPSVHAVIAHQDEADWLSDDNTNVAATKPSVAVDRVDTATTNSSSPSIRSSQLRVRSSQSSLRARKSMASLRMRSVQGKRAADEERWIAMLERQNEELLSQVALLTRDLTQSERKHKALLRREQDEVAHLQQELRNWTTAVADQTEAHRRERAAFRTQLVDARLGASKTEGEQAAQLTRLHGDLAALARERDTAVARAKRAEQDALFLKRRNAALAEELLAKKTLELTVEGQQRYLLELSSALDRMQEEQDQQQQQRAAESSSSPLSADSQFCASRPGSFDGHALTQEVLASLALSGSHSQHGSLPRRDARRLSLSDPVAVRRLFTSPASQLQQPPIQPISPRQQHLQSELMDMPPSPPATTYTDTEPSLCLYNPSPRASQPAYQQHRRVASLWAELSAVDDAPSANATSSKSRPSTLPSQTSTRGTASRGGMRRPQRAPAFQDLQAFWSPPLEYFRGQAFERATRAVWLLSVWFKFLLVLMAAFMFAVYEGPMRARSGEGVVRVGY